MVPAIPKVTTAQVMHRRVRDIGHAVTDPGNQIIDGIKM